MPHTSSKQITQLRNPNAFFKFTDSNQNSFKPNSLKDHNSYSKRAYCSKTLEISFKMIQRLSFSFICFFGLLCMNHNFSSVLPVCHDTMIKGEFFISKPSQCIRHETTSIVNGSANMYYPNENFLKVPISTCEIYETTAESTTYFLEAKTNNKHIKSVTPPSVAVCTDCSHSMQSSCCGRLTPLSKHSWSTTNKPAVVYVWPKTYKEMYVNCT